MSEPIEIGGLRVTSHKLPFEKSQPLIPTIGQIISIAVRELAPLFVSGKIKATDDMLDPKVWLAIAPAVHAICEFLDGKLEKLAPQILASTSVVMSTGSQGPLNYELMKPKDRAAVFDAHPEIYFQVLFHAGRTTFGRFFPAFGRSDGDTPTQ